MTAVNNITKFENQQIAQSKTAAEEALERLRAKYENKPAEVFEPKFRRVADKVFNARGTRNAPYAGIPTLLTAPARAYTPEIGRAHV